jgi:DNA repair protein RadC
MKTELNGIEEMASAILEGREDAKLLLNAISTHIGEKLDSMEKLNDVKDSVIWFRSVIGLQDSEQFAAIFLDQGNKVLARKIYAMGSRTRTVLYPRLLFKDALMCDAAQIIIAHNHPGGNTAFSAADRSLTQIVASTGERLEVILLEHIVVTATGCSFATEKGYLY